MPQSLNPHIKPLPVDPKTGMPYGFRKALDLVKPYRTLPEDKMRLMEEGRVAVDLPAPTLGKSGEQTQALPVDPQTGMPPGFTPFLELPEFGNVKARTSQPNIPIPNVSRIPEYLKNIETPFDIFGTVPKGVENPLKPESPAQLSAEPNLRDEISRRWDPYKDRAWAEVFHEAVKQFPKSSFNAMRDMANAFTHFKDTAKALGRLAGGAVQSTIPGEQKYEKDVRAVFDFFKSRYGSLPAFKRAVAKDPAGILLDASMFLNPTARAIRVAGEAWNIPRAQKVAEAVQSVERATNPIEITRKGANLTKRLMGMATIPKKLPNAMYQKASKFSAALRPKEAEYVTDLALKHDILPNINGFAKAYEKIDAINNNIVNIIEKSTARNELIPIDVLFLQFDDLAKESRILGSTPGKTKKMLDRLKNDIRQINAAHGKTTFTPMELQKRKQRIYKKLERDYAKVKYSNMRVKAEKSMAYMAKKSLEYLMPELKGLNANESELLRITDTIGEVAKTYGIMNPLKQGDIFQHLMALYSMAPVKSRLALALNRLRQKGRIVSDDSLLVRLVESPELQTGGFQAGRATETLKTEYPRDYLEEESQ